MWKLVNVPVKYFCHISCLKAANHVWKVHSSCQEKWSFETGAPSRQAQLACPVKPVSSNHLREEEKKWPLNTG